MSALAHMIEGHGVPTVVIGLVRPHLEQSKPPRSLWVPFPLGRPLGEPEDPAFQRRVLLEALRLLEHPSRAVVLADFADDAPSMRDTPGWRPGFTLASRATPTAAADWAQSLAEELAAVLPHWQAAQRRFGRTMVGTSHLAPQSWLPYAVRFLSGEIPPSPIVGMSPAVTLRHIADDIKALYGEAAQASGPQPSAAQINRWFWGETLAADFLRALRAQSLLSEDNGFKTVGGRFIVPAPFVAKA